MQSNSSTLNNTSNLPTPKRRFAERSPEFGITDNSVGKMSATDLMEMMHVSMSKLFDDKLQNLATKEDLKKVEVKVETFAIKVDEIVKENENLKLRVMALEENKNKDHKTIVRLEEHMKRRNIIIRGVKKGPMYEEVDSIFRQKLKINSSLEVENIRKLHESDAKMTVIVEFKSERMVQEILKNTKNLKGTEISIELDLGSERLQDKKVMIQLKKDILFINKSLPVSVRNDKLKIGTKWFKWNNSKELMCGIQKGENVLKTLYGDVISCLDLNYNNIFNKVNSKN